MRTPILFDTCYKDSTKKFKMLMLKIFISILVNIEMYGQILIKELNLNGTGLWSIAKQNSWHPLI